MSAQKPLITVGIDLGDRFSRYCIVNADGEVMEEGRIATTAAALERHFAGEARQRIAMECGTHSPWVSRLLQGMGHEVWVANARKIRAITVLTLDSPTATCPRFALLLGWPGVIALGTRTGCRLSSWQRSRVGDVRWAGPNLPLPGAPSCPSSPCERNVQLFCQRQISLPSGSLK